MKIYWACYRFIKYVVFEPVWFKFFGHKHHIIKTGIKPGPWIDVDTRMLYGVMELVKWFVENDMQIWTKEDYETECKRIEDEENGWADQLDGFKKQYNNDQKIIEIYKWWLSYTNRQDEITAATAKWHRYVSGFQKDKDDFMSFFDAEMNMNEEQKKEAQRLLEETHSFNMKLETEEQEMLKLAVELRGNMWS